MDKVNLFTVILVGGNALFWIVKLMYDLSIQKYSSFNTSLMLTILCAVIWSLSFIVNCRRYCHDRDKE